MMRENFAVARQRIEIETVDLVDLSATPWRRIMLSARENIWTLVDAEDCAWLSENNWNVSWGSRSLGSSTPSATRGRIARRSACIARS
jgi:hypothetical protein